MFPGSCVACLAPGAFIVRTAFRHWSQLLHQVEQEAQAAHAVHDAAGNSTAVWTACLRPQPPGGPHNLAVKVRYEGAVMTIALEDILFGDVWVASGQSNMAFGVPGTFSFTQECAAVAKFPNVRLYSVSPTEAATELADLGRDAIALPWVSAASPGALCGARDDACVGARPRHRQITQFRAVCCRLGGAQPPG